MFADGSDAAANVAASWTISEPIAKKLEAELMRTARLPDVSQRIKETSSVMGSTSEDFADFIRRETPIWAAIIKENNIKLGN